SALSITVTSIASPCDSDREVASSMPAKPAPRISTRFFMVASDLARLRNDAQVWLNLVPTVRIKSLGLFVRNSRHDDHVFALLPIHRRGHAVPGGELHRVDHAQNFIEIPPRRHRIRNHELDLLVRPNDVNGAHRLVVGGGAGAGVAGSVV